MENILKLLGKIVVGILKMILVIFLALGMLLALTAIAYYLPLNVKHIRMGLVLIYLLTGFVLGRLTLK